MNEDVVAEKLLFNVLYCVLTVVVVAAVIPKKTDTSQEPDHSEGPLGFVSFNDIDILWVHSCDIFF